MAPSWIILVVGLAVTLFLAWRAWYHHARSRTIGGTPLSTVASLTEGPTKLEGTAVALGELLESPVTKTPCLHFKLVVEEEHEFVENRRDRLNLGTAHPHQGRGRIHTQTSKQWVKVIEDAQQAECGLEDETGVAEVELFDAEPTLLGKEAQRKGLIDQCPAELKREIAERTWLPGRNRALVVNEPPVLFHDPPASSSL